MVSVSLPQPNQPPTARSPHWRVSQGQPKRPGPGVRRDSLERPRLPEVIVVPDESSYRLRSTHYEAPEGSALRWSSHDVLFRTGFVWKSETPQKRKTSDRWLRCTRTYEDPADHELDVRRVGGRSRYVESSGSQNIWDLKAKTAQL